MNYSIEKILYKIRNASRIQNGKNEVSADMVAELASAVKDADEIFLLTNSITKTPAVIDEKAYLFSSKQIAKKTQADMKKLGFNTVIVSTSDIFTSIFQFLYSYGVKYVYINKGKNGIGLPLSVFIVPERDIRSDIYNQIKTAVNLNAAINNMAMAFGNDFGESKNAINRLKCESEFTRELAKSKVCFLSTGVLPEKTLLQNGDSAYFIFSDVAELVTTFPFGATAANMKTMPMVDLLKSIPDANECPIILNAGTSEITIGAENVIECLEYESVKEQIVDFCKCLYTDAAVPNDKIDAIMKYKDIYTEFVSGIKADQSQFSYPENGSAVVVDNFNAEMLQRTSAKDPIDAYSKLSEMRDNLV